MNRLVFTKLYVDGEEIVRAELAEAVRDFVEAQRVIYRQGGLTSRFAIRAAGGTSNASGPAEDDGAAWSQTTETDLLVTVLSGFGSSRAVMVGTAGFEPATPRL